MTELTPVPEGYEWPGKQYYLGSHDREYYFEFLNEDKKAIAYVDKIKGKNEYVVVKRHMDSNEEDLATLSTLEEAKHYCHMLVLTGVI